MSTSIITPVYGTSFVYDIGDDGREEQGDYFDDTPSLERFPDAMVSRIAIRYGRLIDSLQVSDTNPSLETSAF